MSAFTESVVEEAALCWLESLGWSVAHGPEIAPEAAGAERARSGSKAPLGPTQALTALHFTQCIE